MKKILMIAFHYPPVLGSSGVHRSLSFSRYLPEHGWQPIVLTVRPMAHAMIDPGQYARIPDDIVVERALALDSARHLSIRGSYLSLLALPDRWITWWPGAVIKGLQLIRRHRPHIIWSTYPIATAHLIGLTLHKLSRVPLVADFRDPMTERNPVTGEEFPAEAMVRRVHRWIERPVVRTCAKAVFTTQGTLQMYADRFRDVGAARWAVIPNGYDEESFAQAQKSCTRTGGADRILLLHSGVLYPDSRNPGAFFEAVAMLAHQGQVSPANLKILLRASGGEDVHRRRISELGIQDIISLEGTIPYQQALSEMLGADGLLLFQGADCNAQIPAKAYEYLRAQRPIFACADAAGDTAKLLRSEGLDTIVPIDSCEEIALGLRDFLRRIRQGTAPILDRRRLEHYSRRVRTRELATLLDSVAGANDESKRCEHKFARPRVQAQSRGRG